MDLHVETGRVARHLRTERLLLRPLTRDDLSCVARMANDFAVGSMMTDVPYPFGAADAEQLWIVSLAGKLGSAWVIDDGSGFCGLISIRPELGYWLGREKWGRGYMTEALRAAIAAWFGGTDEEAIPSCYFHDNPASGMVLRKLGFQQVSLHVQRCAARGEDVMGFAMALDRGRWQALARDRPKQEFHLEDGEVTLRDLRGADLQELSLQGIEPAAADAMAYRGNPPQAHPFLLTITRAGWPVGIAYVDHTADGLTVDCRPSGPIGDEASCRMAKSALERHGATHWGTAPLEVGRGVA